MKRITFLKKGISLVCAILMLTAVLPTALAAEYTSDDCYVEGYDTSVEIVEEGAVLLKNANGILPLQDGAKVTLLGSMSYNYVGGDDDNTVMMDAAFIEAGLDVNMQAWNWLETMCGGKRGVRDADPSGLGDWDSYAAIHEFPIEEYEKAKSEILVEGYCDTAIVTLSRTAAEGSALSMDLDGDGSTVNGTTYLELDDNERNLMKFCKENFKHTIVLLNTSSAMEIGFLDSEEYNVEACLWIGHPGDAGLVGVGKLITGAVNPSGRLVDTWAYDVSTNPTFYNMDNNRYANGQDADNNTFYQYEEGIYVGYRFFETADAEGYFDSPAFTGHAFKNGTAAGYEQVVQFPFGFGLSYTTFEQKIIDSDVKLDAHEQNAVTVRVTNTGSVGGKEVVQLYMDAPYQSDTEHFGIQGRGLEKSKVTLIAFAKTKNLEPGQSQDITLKFDTDELASFDNFGQGCYVLEKGNYKFNVQSDAHRWGEEETANAPLDTVAAELSKSVIYDDAGDVADAEYVGARSSDKSVARNAMDDVTAGDGCMLDGYLSRSNFADGMEAIMAHQSDEEPNELLKDEIVEIMSLANTQTYDYTFETYRNGVKTEQTKTFYAFGADMIPFAAETPDGKAVAQIEAPEWGKVYYVAEDQTTESGLPVVTETVPEGNHHVLSVADMTGVPIDTEEGGAIWEMLTNMTTLDEAIEIQGNCGWMVPAIPSVGKPKQVCVDGPEQCGTSASATGFPGEPLIAATWNTETAQKMGVAYGHQAVLFNYGCVYAPGMDTHRSPFGGRNHQYYSEDGFIGGQIGGNVVQGIQSTGTSVFVKHLALNDSDTNRDGVLTWANEQAIREVYMRPFEITAKDYNANGFMASLNRIGTALFPYGMYVTMLRSEWGWNGLLITDGNCGTGDVYNNPLAILSVQGATLGYGNYITMAATEAAFGDSTQSVYAQYQLHEMMRNCLYQYCGTKTTDADGNVISGPVGVVTTTNQIPVGLIVIAVVGVIVAGGIVGAVIVSKNKKKKQA